MAQNDAGMAPETKKGKGRITLILILSIALIIAAGAAAYFYWKTVQLEKSPQNVARQQEQNIIAKVSHLILLPQGETPTIATVTDPSLLKGQAFFVNAQKGDEILIYTNAKEAILYRPSTDIIVNVAPLSIGSTPAPATSTTAPTTPSGATTSTAPSDASTQTKTTTKP